MKGLRLLLIPAVALLFLGLGANTIWDANEAFYADTPRQMIRSGDYLTPTFNGQPRMNKPVLSYWVVAGLYHLFGDSVTVERFGIALGALGILLAAYLCGRALRSPPTGWLAVLIVATAPQFVMFSRRIFIDIWVTMFMALSIGCFLLAESQPARRRLWLAAMYVAVGLGVLTKGPVALVFPAAAIGLWLLVERRFSDIRRLWILPGAVIVLAINLPWWWALYSQHGAQPIKAFWLGENLGRYTEPMQPGERDIFFYVPVVIGDLFPWSLFVIAGLISGAAAFWRRSESSATRRFLMIWVVAIVGVFSFSETKQDLYVFPIVPALAALSAEFIILGLDSGSRVRALLAGTGALLIIAGAGIARLFGAWAPAHQISGATGMAVTLVLGGIAVALLAWRRRAAAGVLTLAGALVIANYFFVLRSLPAVEEFKPVVPMVRTIQTRTQPGKPPPVVAHYITSLPSLTYYLDRPIEGYFGVSALVDRAKVVPEMYVLMRPHEYADFERAAKAQALTVCIVERRTLFEAKLKLVLDGTPWPEVFLVGTGAACSPREP
ncbi:MAG TPA: glycosyltransferase family 39 protein [Vicinamibacterales bacterium]|nr:glycosyltransferase family 39 protein [Vicinamibacterales bacterium]